MGTNTLVLTPDASLRKEVSSQSGQTLSACYRCEKCTNGCPVTAAMDIPPHRLMHLLNLGMVDEVLKSDTIWLCASCETCSTRCPNGIDIARVMDTLRQMCRKQGIAVRQYSVPIFHKAFLNSIKRHGRVSETELALNYYVEDVGWLGFMKQVGTGFAMFLRGKIKIIPKRIRDLKVVRKMFDKVDARFRT